MLGAIGANDFSRQANEHGKRMAIMPARESIRTTLNA
jgi:hypothetical protein